jgi:hypothetical protein
VALPRDGVNSARWEADVLIGLRSNAPEKARWRHRASSISLALRGVGRSLVNRAAMKTRLLWALILSVGSTALYCGLARPEVSTTPKRIQDFIDRDPATRPPIQLPPLVVSESRLPDQKQPEDTASAEPD